MDRAQHVKQQYEEDLLRYPHVVGVGVGFRKRGGRRTDEVCIVAMVDRKETPDDLDDAAVLPAHIEGVPIDVQEVGTVTGEDHA